MRGSMRIGGLISDSFPFQQLSVSSRRGDRQVEYLGDRGSHRPVISFLIAGYDIIGYDTSLLIRWTRQWYQGWFACHEVAYFHGISQRINIRVRGLHIFIDSDTAECSDRKSRFLGQSGFRTDTDTQ